MSFCHAWEKILERRIHMPRVYLTAEQREQAAIDKIRLALSDGIAVQKSRNRLTN